MKANNTVLKLYLFCVILVIGLLDLGLNVISVVPGAGDAAETASESVLEVIQIACEAVIIFVRRGAAAKAGQGSGFIKILAFCAFIVVGVLDIGGNVISLIPVVGDIGETITEVVAELIQLAIAAYTLLF